MKNIFAAIVLVILFVQSASATTYFFTGNEDSFYENPANWSPSFPGYTVGKQDCFVINANMSFEGYNVTIEGKMIVELGATITSPSNGFVIKESGKLSNNGEMALGLIINHGEISNSESAIIFADTYSSTHHAPVSNLVYVNTIANQSEVEGIADAGIHRMQDMNYRMQGVSRGKKTATTPAPAATPKDDNDAAKYVKTTKTKK